MRPHPDEYAQSPYTSRYIDMVTEADPIAVLEQKALWQLLHPLSEAQSEYRYAEGKWSIKQLVGHMTDTERIFTYRALCMARDEKQPLPGFDENSYVDNGFFEQRTLDSLLTEYKAVREASLVLFRSLDASVLSHMGTASGNPLSVRALLYMIAGHEKHHIHILQERYLN